MEGTVTAQEMKAIEKAAADRGMPYLTMMENAGRAAAEEILRAYPLPGKLAVILAGKGNNGGDGLVTARYLKEAGALTLTLLAQGPPATPDAQTNLRRCQEAGIEIIEFQPGRSEVFLEGADLIVDAVYGAGFHGSLPDPVRGILRAVNRAEAKVAALDLPSGLSADDAQHDPDAVRADLTVAFARLKRAQALPEGLGLCGRLILADIGI